MFLTSWLSSRFSRQQRFCLACVVKWKVIWNFNSFQMVDDLVTCSFRETKNRIRFWSFRYLDSIWRMAVWYFYKPAYGSIRQQQDVLTKSVWPFLLKSELLVNGGQNLCFVTDATLSSVRLWEFYAKNLLTPPYNNVNMFHRNRSYRLLWKANKVIVKADSDPLIH